ncbi:MAG: M48 family metalloprotease, partial [Cyanobacteria bacterium P01_F01_bin.42]
AKLGFGTLGWIAVAGAASFGSATVARAHMLEIGLIGGIDGAEPSGLVDDEASVDDSVSISAPEVPLTPEQLRFNLLEAADQFYQSGRATEARLLYKKAKRSDERSASSTSLPEPTFEVENGAVKVYWREGNDGLDQGLESKVIVPLTLLTESYPEFIPGHLKLAEGHNRFGRPEEALNALERGASVYPAVTELQESLMQQQVSMKLWLPASITARQFATLNPDHPRAAEFRELSEQYQKKFRAVLRGDITSNAIGSVLTGALSVGLGNPFGAISPIRNAIALLRGEDSVGRSAAKSYLKKLPVLEDETVNAYVDRIGQKLASVAGREMDYEFYVINDERLNAFALPGGKIFIHSGAILKTRSEAELAGLLAHEISHAVLSHGFQMYTQSNATGNALSIIPFSGLFSRIAVTKYSRDLERQADLLGTRILASSGYAADGLENLSHVLLKEEGQKKKRRVSWLSTHPDTEDRIQYLGELIERNGYSRYAYEGVTEHAQIQGFVRTELDKLKQLEQDAEPDGEASDDTIAER